MEFKDLVYEEIKILKELQGFYDEKKSSKDATEKSFIESHIKLLESKLDKIKSSIVRKSNDFNLEVKKEEFPEESKSNNNFGDLERKTLLRIKKGKKIKIVEKEKVPSKYIAFANKIFFNVSKRLNDEDFYHGMKRNLKRSNLDFLPQAYISMMLLTTVISVFVGFFIFLFFLFFNLSPLSPFITLVEEDFFNRLGKVFWILFIIPTATYFFILFYPAMERKSVESRIDEELPFATLNMAAISGSMVDPSRIFDIIIKTNEYPFIRKEFVKVLNQINIYGYDLVSALRICASKTPSKKLSELFNGLAINISSGGNLPTFFEKRSQSLLFDYRLEREKATRSAETFMDIYISVVVAAPMILMLLLMMMKISGFGINLSTGMITLIMILGVTGINILFITMLHLKRSEV